MSGMLSRRKGKLGEQGAVQLLRAAFPLVRSKRAGGETLTIDRGRDLLDTPGFCVQVMRAARPDIHRKFSEAAAVAKPDEIPVALTRRDRGQWLATIPASAFVAMVDQLEKLRRDYATLAASGTDAIWRTVRIESNPK